MGTRSLTHIKDDEGRKTLITLYRQYDGYPSGMGKDLAELLKPLGLVNGYGGGAPQANGMGCAAAQIIKGLKDDVGNLYVYAANSKDCGEEYTYTIRPANGTFRITVADYYGKKLFDGLVSDYDGEAIENAEE